MFTQPVIIAVTVAESNEDEEEDEEEEEAAGDSVDDGGGEGDGDCVHHLLRSSHPLRVSRLISVIQITPPL